MLFSSLLSWLGLGRPTPSVGLRPQSEFEIACSEPEARARCLEALVNVAGANVQSDEGDSIEAGFGIVNSERLRIRIEALDATRTRIRIEALYPARLAPPPRSMAVDALARALGPTR